MFSPPSMDGWIDRSIGSNADQNTKRERGRIGRRRNGGECLKEQERPPSKTFHIVLRYFGSLAHTERAKKEQWGNFSQKRRFFALFMTSNRPRAACYHTTQVEKTTAMGS